MAKQNARELLVKAKIGAATTFEMICGLTTRNITLNSNLVDVTSINCDDPGGPVWRETIPGIQSMDVSGNGYFDHADQFFALYDAQKSDSGVIDMEIVFPTVGTFAGKFAVGSMDISGNLEGAINQSITLQSSGIVELTRLPAA